MSLGGEPMAPRHAVPDHVDDEADDGATVLALVDAGMLDLDGPVDELLPELANRRVLAQPRRRR